VLAQSFKIGQATCDMHLPENSPVRIKIKLGQNNPIDWINHVS
jgi:hypothetical protein